MAIDVAREVAELVAAGTSIVYLVTHEERRAVETLAALGAKLDRGFAVWSSHRGLHPTAIEARSAARAAVSVFCSAAGSVPDARVLTSRLRVQSREQNAPLVKCRRERACSRSIPFATERDAKLLAGHASVGPHGATQVFGRYEHLAVDIPALARDILPHSS